MNILGRIASWTIPIVLLYAGLVKASEPEHLIGYIQDIRFIREWAWGISIGIISVEIALGASLLFPGAKKLTWLGVLVLLAGFTAFHLASPWLYSAPKPCPCLGGGTENGIWSSFAVVLARNFGLLILAIAGFRTAKSPEA